MTDRPPPDFAMTRAADILANIVRETQTRSPQAAPRLPHPVLLRGDRITLAVGSTTRAAVECILGAGGEYPVAGWASYAISGPREPLALVSAFYRDDLLIAAELYRSRAQSVPGVPRVATRFRLDPIALSLGDALRVPPAGFIRAQSGPAGTVYGDAFEARFPGGVAFAMGNAGVAERLVLYAER